MHFDIDISAPGWFWSFAIIGAVYTCHAAYVLVRDGYRAVRNLVTKRSS